MRSPCSLSGRLCSRGSPFSLSLGLSSLNNPEPGASPRVRRGSLRWSRLREDPDSQPCPSDGVIPVPEIQAPALALPLASLAFPLWAFPQPLLPVLAPGGKKPFLHFLEVLATGLWVKGVGLRACGSPRGSPQLSDWAWSVCLCLSVPLSVCVSVCLASSLAPQPPPASAPSPSGTLDQAGESSVNPWTRQGRSGMGHL